LEKAIDAASQRGKTMGDELGKNWVGSQLVNT
jgi:hypothetical protein